MTMIEVKSTKSSGDQQTGRQRLEADSAAPNSTTPFYVGLMLTSLLLYFKSIHDAWAAPVPPRHRPEAPEEEAAPVSSDLSASSSPASPQDEVTDSHDNVVQGRFAAAKNNALIKKHTIEDEAPMQFDAAAFTATSMQFDGSVARSMLSQGTAVGFSVQSSNDNSSVAPPPQSLASGDAVTEASAPAPTEPVEPPNENSGETPDPEAAPRAGEPVASPPQAASPPQPLPVDQAGNDNGEPDDAEPLKANGTTANRRPVVQQQVVLYDQFASMAVLIAITDLLRHSSDPDGDVLKIMNAVTSSGELVLTDGGYRFVADELGNVTFTYQVSDGTESVEQTATFNVIAPPEAAASLARSAKVDGDDVVSDPATQDQLILAASGEAAFGPGDDAVIVAGSDDDVIKAGDGDDIVYAGAGNDIVYGGSGHDQLHGESGNDQIYGEAGDDELSGGSGDDMADGGDGDDIVSGDEGNDILSGGRGIDRVLGGSGDDLIHGAIDGAADMYDGGSQFDTLDFSAADLDLTFDIGEGTVSGGGETDLFAGFESFVAGTGDDVFAAVIAQPDDVSSATAETETTADQTFDGGEGNDTITYGAAAQDIVVDVSAGEAEGVEIGTDTLVNIEIFETGAGDDTFTAVIAQPDADMPSAVVETTTTADQTFIGGAGTDTLDYSEAAQEIVIDVAAGEATGVEIGTDTVAEIEVFETGAGDDTFTAVVAQPDADTPSAVVETTTTADQTFDGGAGTDTLDYSEAAREIVVDVAAGEATGVEIGTDTVAGIEIFETGAGDDTFAAAVAQPDSDMPSAVVETTTTADQTFIGGAGTDTLDYSEAVQDIIVDVEAGEATGVEIGTDSFSNIEAFETGAGDDTFMAAVDTAPETVAVESSVADLILSLQDADQTQIYDGGAGTDTLDYGATESGVLIDVMGGEAAGDDIGVDGFENIETFVGGSGNDRFEAAGLGLSTQVAAASGAMLPEDVTAPVPEETETVAAAPADEPVEETVASGPAPETVSVAEVPDLVAEANAAASASIDAAVRNLTDVLVQAVEQGASRYETAVDISGTVDEISSLKATIVPDNTFIGGAGTDTLSYAGATESVTIDTTTGIATGSQIGTDSFSGIESFVGGSGNDTIIVGAGAVTLDGNGGNDLFVFLSDTGVTSTSRSSGSTTQQISNFEVGDVVRMSRYDIFTRAIDELENAFEETYGEGTSTDADLNDIEDIAIPIRIRHEMTDDLMRTYIDADFDGNGEFEVSVQLDGHHDLIIVNHNN